MLPTVAQLADSGTLGEIFYRHLFAKHPELRPLFATSDMGALQVKLLQSFTLCVEGLKDPEILRPAITELGRRHVAYGALEQHLVYLGEALVAAMAEISGDAWTQQRQDALVQAFAGK
jgi:hemoglobin-like flavoprotein